MTETIYEMAFDIVQREGGYVDNPADKGGPTNHGITLAVAKKHGYSDVQQITVPIAEQIMVEQFYNAPGFDKLDPVLQPQMFDIAVNSGASEAVKLLQHAVSHLGCEVEIDGALGPKTVQVVQAAVSYFGAADVNDALVDARVAFYKALVAKNPAEQQFLKGWIARAETFEMVKAQKLDAQQPFKGNEPVPVVSLQVVAPGITAPAPATASASRSMFEAFMQRARQDLSLV